MALGFLIHRGLESVLGADDSRLEELAAELGAPLGSAEHIRQTLVAMPGLMRAVDSALRAPDAAPAAQHLWLSVVSYLLHDRDLVPAEERSPILGLLDDCYLLHRAVLELEPHVEDVDMRSVAGGAALIARLLPRRVVVLLDERLADVKAQSEGRFGARADAPS